ncbi:MAG TPA: hypothetical protein VGI92_11095 [Gemmatimonadales bacterium]|jgi:hypothetical protein
MASTMKRVEKAARKGAKALKLMVQPRRTSKLKTAAKVAAVGAAVVGAGLAARAIAKKAKKR